MKPKEYKFFKNKGRWICKDTKEIKNEGRELINEAKAPQPVSGKILNSHSSPVPVIAGAAFALSNSDERMSNNSGAPV